MQRHLLQKTEAPAIEKLHGQDTEETNKGNPKVKIKDLEVYSGQLILRPCMTHASHVHWPAKRGVCHGSDERRFSTTSQPPLSPVVIKEAGAAAVGCPAR